MSASAASLPATRRAIVTSPKAAHCVVPEALQQFLQKLKNSSVENERKAMWDGLKFWSLKAPAILVAGGSGITAIVNAKIGLSVAILNGILSICVVLDGLLHPGEHRNVHLRAAEELRNLKEDIESKWQIRWAEGHTSSALLAEILDAGWRARKKINAYVEGTLFASSDSTAASKPSQNEVQPG